MKAFRKGLAVAAITGGLMALAPAAHCQLVGGGTAAETTREAMLDAVARVKQSLVRITVVEPAYYDGREVKGVSFGSGTIITEDGHVVTNHHVAGKAVRLLVTMPNREEIPAELIGTDAATDIAVIKLKPKAPTKFPVARFGDSETVKVGDPVLALGSPLALSQSVTLGIVSNTEMVMPRAFSRRGMELDGENVGELVRWFGHDAAIYGGNSGGPLVNMKGEIIGVNELSFGLAGAIPGNLARKVAEQIIEQGHVTRSYVGVILQPLLDSSPVKEGVLVSSILKDSPAEKAGVKPGDILLSIAGTTVEGRFDEDLPLINNLLADLPVGQPSKLVVLRNGDREELTVNPEQREPAVLKSEELREWGLTASDLSVWTQLQLARESREGALVTSVRDGGPAARAKPDIRRGDIIVKLNDREVKSLEDFKNATKELLGTSTELVPVLVTYEREDEQLLTVASIGIEDLDDPGAEVRKAWLPIETQVLTRDLARQLGKETVKGVRVTRVFPDRPEDFPLQVGDIITHIDGDPVEAAEPHDSQVFITMVRQYKVNTAAEFTVLRDGEKKSLETTMLRSPATSREMKRYKDHDFEITLREAAYQDRQKRELLGTDFSVVVESVVNGGWADLAGLQANDVLLEINGQSIENIDKAREILKGIKGEKPETVTFFVRRGANHRFVEVEPSWDDLLVSK